VPDGVTVRSTRRARIYAPGDFVEHVSPMPLVMLVANHGHMAVTDRALKAYERRSDPRRSS
jgi:hypothetical protein